MKNYCAQGGTRTRTHSSEGALPATEPTVSVGVDPSPAEPPSLREEAQRNSVTDAEKVEAEWMRLLPFASEFPFHVVYFVRGANGLIKVGTSGDLRQRLKSLRADSATPIHVLAWIEGGKTLEQSIHAALAPHRHHNEWLRPSEDLERILDVALDDDARPHDLTLHIGRLEHLSSPCAKSNGCWCHKDPARLEATRSTYQAPALPHCEACGLPPEVRR